MKKQLFFHSIALPGLLTLLFVVNTVAQPPNKVSQLGKYQGYNLENYNGFKTESLYLTLRDSIQLALDVHLPKGLEASKKIPAILYLTRYVRSLQPIGSIRWLTGPIFGNVPKEEVKYLTTHGYACIIVDVRGTGASTGSRTMEFSSQEIADGAEVVDWIIRQPWSNGKVGSTGVSYLGTTAELLLVNQHPAVQASVIRSGTFDLYEHIAFPGGVRQGPFLEVWRNSTYALDNSKLGYFSFMAGLVVKGVKPVDGDKGRKKLRSALEDHEDNFDIFKEFPKLVYRDQLITSLGKSMNNYSPHFYGKEIEGSKTPIYRISGWYDGANMKSAIQGFLSTQNSQKLLIGPWDHGPFEFISPFGNTSKVTFDVYAEILRFFDFHLKGIDNGILEEPPIHYYNMGQEQWRSASQWPEPNIGKQTFFFSADSMLIQEKNKIQTGSIPYEVDYTFSTGAGARWHSLTPAYRMDPIGYPDWTARASRLLTFSTEPVPQPTEITGYPVVELHLKCDGTDPTIFVYLQDQAPDGRLTYITEGQFRAIHRKESNDTPPYPMLGPYHTFKESDSELVVPGKPFEVTFELLPISYELPKGHRLQVAISGADVDHFDVPQDRPETLEVLIAEGFPSQILVPIR